MTNEPSAGREEGPHSPASTVATEGGDEQQVPPGMLPLVEPVFGRWAFWICAVPFLIYLGGTTFGTYLENVRKTGPAHSMRGYVRGHVKLLQAHINELPEDQAEQINQRLDPAAVIVAMDDENSDLEGIVRQCEKLRTDDLAGLPPSIDGVAHVAQAFLNHFLVLEQMIEEGEDDKILEEHEAFIVAQNLPQEQVPKLTTSWYPVCYSVVCLAAFLAMLAALPGYLKHPFRVTPLAIGVGIAGIVVWVGLWWLDREYLHLGEFLGAHSRAGFNPFRELRDQPRWMYTFLGIRVLGLCIVVPVAEEFFSRGFLMRYIEDVDWDQIPLGEATWRGLLGILAYGALSHPGEVLAALAWFGLVTWMYLRKKNIWDCVLAHAITNALLALYVVQTNTWELW